MFPRTLILAALLAAGGPAFAAAPAITLPDGRTVQLSQQALAALPQQSVAASAHGKSATYGGYDLRQVLEAVGVQSSALRGKAMATTVTVAAADGYRVVFALTELDPTLGNRQVLLVDRENGQPLPAKDGPWRLVVPADRRPARWERQVEAIVVSDAPAAAKSPSGPATSRSMH